MDSYHKHEVFLVEAGVAQRNQVVYGHLPAKEYTQSAKVVVKDSL